LPALTADKGQLETVLVNLATNARDAMESGGSLTFSASAEDTAMGRPGRYVRIAVTDTGTGMDSATRARAMDPFFTTKGRGEGNGLGLAMARGFAEQSGGALSIKSEPGAGTSVFLWLPVEQRAMPVVKPMDSAPEAKPRAPRLRILLVEDEDLVRQVVAMQLEDEGHEVLQASNAEEALQMLEQSKTTDALVTDFNMPRMNGVELIRALRARGMSIPAILLTGNAEDGAPLAVESTTQQDFALLRKPVLGSVLASRLISLTVGG
jgi:CheY-like chemotaxis protein/anti-sigma regulatory factor (Ser/Thr protein kinase)